MVTIAAAVYGVNLQRCPTKRPGSADLLLDLCIGLDLASTMPDQEVG
jgi:hypothetical protein